MLKNLILNVLKIAVIAGVTAWALISFLRIESPEADPRIYTDEEINSLRNK